jgi:dCTP deaminase
MILTRNEILKRIDDGRIIINPFSIDKVDVNGYSFTLGEELKIIKGYDKNFNPEFYTINLNDYRNGFILYPDLLYLGLTVENFISPLNAMILYGNKHIGSMGIWVNITAPLAHTGSAIRWTLEIACAKPVKIYPNIIFGKVYFLDTLGEINTYGQNINDKYTKDRIDFYNTDVI